MRINRQSIKDFEEMIIRHMPERLLENPYTLAEKYRILYGAGDYKEKIAHRRRQTARKYIAAFLIAILLLMGIGVNQYAKSRETFEPERPAYGQAARTLPVEVSITAENVKTNMQMMLKLAPAALTDAEKQKYLKACADNLPEKIKGDNPSLLHVTKDIALPEADDRGQISITWDSDQPEVLEKDGVVDNVGWLEKKAREVTLTAKLSMDGARMEKQYTVTVLPNDQAEHVRKVLERRVKKASELAGKNESGKAVILPQNVGKGTKLEWKEVENNYVTEIIGILLFLCAWIYKTRYGNVEKQIRLKREAVVKEFPEFADKLVMLLGAGMVVSAALSKIPEDYERCRNNGPRKVLYEELLGISRKVKSTNASYIEELSRLAERLGVKELLRMTAIITENINKGSTLAEKLEAEGEMLWQGRKKRAEELGRLADTRLVLPLVLLLGTLVVVSVAPAWMTM